MKKRVTILHHNGGRLANQLWLFASVYAYCLEKGYECRNYSFFEYQKYFTISSGSWLFDFFAKLYGSFELKSIFLKKAYRKIARIIYVFLVYFIETIHHGKVLRISNLNTSSYKLPPSARVSSEIFQFDKNHERKELFLCGWLFRNPVGLEKFRDEVRAYFTPKKEYIEKGEELIKELRATYDTIVGVHIRKGDYRVYQGGSLFFSEEEVSEFLFDYMKRREGKKLCFLLFSDEKINTRPFSHLPIFYSPNDTDVGDLFQLASSDIIIGSDSTFSSFASYYGDIPLILFQRGGINWSSYEDKDRYFENKLSSVTK